MLKQISLSVFLLLATKILFGQQISISIIHNNTLYLDMENSISICVEKTASNDLIVKSDNGRLLAKKEIIISILYTSVRQILLFTKRKKVN